MLQLDAAGLDPMLLAVGVTALGVVCGYAAGYWFGMKRGTDMLEIEELDGVENGAGFKAYEGAESSGVLSAWLARRKKQSVLEDGKVRWHLVDSSLSEPMYVEPEAQGGGSQPELKYEGMTYVFPHGASVPSQEEGVPTFVHRKGESDPIDLRDDWDLALDAKALSDYLTMRVTSDAPEGGGLGFLSDMDTMDMLRYGILGLVVLFVAFQMMGGGIA